MKNSVSFLLLVGFCLSAFGQEPRCGAIFAGLGITRPVIDVVVEGSGDVTERFYHPDWRAVVQEKAKEKDVRVTFTDMSRADETPEQREKRLRIKAQIEASGFTYLDKSDPLQMAQYKKLDADYVHLAVPPGAQLPLIKEWASRPLPPIRIFTDKPVGTSAENARAIEKTVPPGSDFVMAIDHYRPKLNLQDPTQVAEIDRFLGGLKSVDVSLFEDRSGADPHAALAVDNHRDGAIEREGRAGVLHDGLATDWVPHMQGMLDYFGDMSSLKPVAVKGGRYTGVDGDPNKPTDIPNETFFGAEFTFNDLHGRPVQGRVIAGKGLRTEKYGPAAEHNAKILELVGNNGNRVVFDLPGSGSGHSHVAFYGADGHVEKTVPLEAHPYKAIFAGVVDGRSHTNGLAFPVRQGVVFREKLEELVAPLRRETLPLYAGGMSGRNARPAPEVEKLWKELPSLSLHASLPVDRDFLMIGGTGVMGKGFSHRIANVAKQKLVIVDPNPKAFDIISRMGEGADIRLAPDLVAGVKSLKRPRRMMLLVPNEKILESVLGQLINILEPGDIVVDGGNSNWKETERRQAKFREKGIHLVGMGVSGGERGAWNGSSMMPGGDREAWEHLKPIFEPIAGQVKNISDPTQISPSVAYIGPGGAGHFVKMTHNGIEYVEMQLIAESYDLMKQLGGLSNAQIQSHYRAWNETELNSFLLGAAGKVVNHPDAKTGTPLVERIKPVAQQKGTGTWASTNALDLGAYAPTLPEAVFARNASGYSSQFDGVRHELAGPTASPLTEVEKDRLTELMPKALYAARLLDFAQGLHLIELASRQKFNGEVDLQRLTGLWRTGSILQGKMLDAIHREYAENPAMKSPLDSPTIRQKLSESQGALREVVEIARRHGIPAPAMGSLLNYYDTVRAQRLPANLLQALRDYFGGHTFEREDMPGIFHDDWGDPASGSSGSGGRL